MVTYSNGSLQDPFSVRLRRRAGKITSWLCVGLDPDLANLPEGISRDAQGVIRFCRAIIDATQDVAVAFKINFAFFEVLGPEGWAALAAVRSAVPAEIPVVADAKRGDIGNTDRAYAQAILGNLDFDAVTVNPYLGWDAIDPFLAYPGKSALVLCRTSNPGAVVLQDMPVDGIPLYMRIARGVLNHWDLREVPGEVGLVIGATAPEALRRVRQLSDEMIFLVPGVGAQGATAVETVEAGANKRGENALIAVSRQIQFASDGSNYATRAGEVARDLARQTWRAAAH